MTERTNLETHVDLCELRYRQLDDRMTRVEQRIDDVTEELKAVKAEMNSGFGEIKTMLTSAKDEKYKTIVTTAGSIIVGLLGLLGYIVVHLK
jgi:chromosome segregation ATPase